MAGRRYCKNTVKGSRRGQKYPPKVRAEVLMAMLSSGSICAVARRYGVPESTIRSWMAEEASRGDAFAKERQAAAREIAIRASLGARAQVSYLQSRVDESQRAAQVRARLHRKLDEDTRARCFAVGTLLKSDAEELADATETGLVLYAAEDSYDRQLDSEERKLLDAQLERYGERVMSDKNAAAMATVLMTVAEKAAAMVPSQSQSEGDAPPLVEIGAEGREEKGPEVMVDGAYRNLRQLQRRTHHPRRQGGCAHDRSRAGRRRQRRGCTGGAGTVRPGSELCGKLQDDRRTAACNGAGNKERRQLGQLFGQKEQQNEKQRERLDEQSAAKYGKDIFFYEGK